MKNILLALAMIAIALLNSCTKVIDINLNEADPKIVIEAELVSGTQDFMVKITKTGDFFNPGQPITVADATVVLKKGTDNAPLSLTNDGDGTYSLKNFTATENTSYTVSVTADGKIYEATDFLPKNVSLDSLSASVPENDPFNSSGADSFQVVLNFQDPPSDLNFYRIKSSVNGIPRSAGEHLLVIEDRYSVGAYFTLPIFTDSYELNDHVDVELVSMSHAMYDYFTTLALLVDGSGSAAPTNPSGNWSGGALGYFGAFSVSKQSILVK
jgi:biopolymer transport protein ExbD